MPDLNSGYLSVGSDGRRGRVVSVGAFLGGGKRVLDHIGESGEEVELSDWEIVVGSPDRPVSSLRPPDEEGNSVAALEDRRFLAAQGAEAHVSLEVLVREAAAVGPVVGREHDEGVVGDVEILERLHEHADSVVELAQLFARFADEAARARVVVLFDVRKGAVRRAEGEIHEKRLVLFGDVVFRLDEVLARLLVEVLHDLARIERRLRSRRVEAVPAVLSRVRPLPQLEARPLVVCVAPLPGFGIYLPVFRILNQLISIF